MRARASLLILLGLAACSSDDEPAQAPAELAFPNQPPPAAGPSAPAPATTAKPAAAPLTALQILPEVVYVFQRDFDGGNWMCTGTLVSKDVVVTAAHCLDPEKFELFQVVAPLIADHPRVEAHPLGTLTNDVENVGNPDVGALKLEKPIDLPAYAELTDVSARIDGGEKLPALAIVREKVDFEAPFKRVDGLTISSTTELGYEHGYGTAMFTHGGDSGAGLFLVEDGKPTHKLVGFARQPDPDRNLDHFTRVDATFLDWFKGATTGAEAATPPAEP
jgi:hypothetical protein